MAKRRLVFWFLRTWLRRIPGLITVEFVTDWLNSVVLQSSRLCDGCLLAMSAGLNLLMRLQQRQSLVQLELGGQTALAHMSV
mgnify:CR=1 FL=1